MVDRVEGTLTRFSFRAEDGAFAVATVTAEGRLGHTVVGPLNHVVEGQHVVLEGTWQDHSSFGRQLKVSSVLVDDPRTKKGLALYLSSGTVKGLGKTNAKRLVAHFGLDTLRVIEEEPERLTEVPGIGKKRAAEITRHWEVDRANRQVVATLRGFGVGQALANRVVEHYGAEALHVVTREPYRLAADLPRVGFKTADAIARQGGLALDDPGRADAAMQHLLSAAGSEGHCFLPRGELLERAKGLDVPREAAEGSLQRLILSRGVVAHDTADDSQQPIYHPRLDQAEALVARRLGALLQRPPDPAPDLSSVEERLGIALNGDQRRAVHMALTQGVAVITGGPGTGKTTIVRAIITAGAEQRWLLAAPTGRAAKRLSESTGQPASTIHRLLEWNPRTGGFVRGPDVPLQADGVLVDEASMLDIKLMRSLVTALPDGCRLVLVGDADQLPSVGPGRVLGDVIGSGVVPVVTLSEIYRQAAGSGIVVNAHRINAGDPPRSGEKEGYADFFFLDRDRVEAAADTLVQVVCERLKNKGFDPLRDVQVLTPMHSGLLGTTALNERLQAALNPGGRKLRHGGREFRVGDRVIQVKNDYDNDIFNGDVGHVAAASHAGLVVEFDDRHVAIKPDKLDDLQLAYAISIHKSQGSEYPAVVVALHKGHFVMLRRNLLYTAVTRARKFCCVVGSAWAARTACEEVGGARRYTRLAERLIEETG